MLVYSGLKVDFLNSVEQDPSLQKSKKLYMKRCIEEQPRMNSGLGRIRWSICIRS